MVKLDQLEEKVKEIKESFYDLIKHSYLEKYIKEPELDEDKLRFIYVMFSEYEPKEDAEHLTISALLVQAALDMHEHVSLHKIHSDTIRKQRQLTVLAGDYYSVFTFIC